MGLIKTSHFTFLTTEDFYIHVEFQTTDSGEDDLRRFHAYEAVINTVDGKWAK